MTTLAVLLGAVVAWAVCRWSIPEITRRQLVAMKSPRGLDVAATGGISLALGGLAGAAVMALLTGPFQSADKVDEYVLLRIAASLGATMAAFALIGLYADLSLANRQTFEFGKQAKLLLWGPAAAVSVLAAPSLTHTRVWHVIGAAGILLSALLITALDKYPLRAMKVAIIWLSVLTLAAVLRPQSAAVGIFALTAGLVAALWVPERQQKLRLGTSGSMALGAALGVATWITLMGRMSPGKAPLVATGILLILWIASTRQGFDAAFARLGPLRAFDRLGQRALRGIDVLEDSPDDRDPQF